ncbi:MAG TPA: hypothetical protein DEB39_12760 [Planctomycetaceae bacterium]|nr:hypothetical protein [Planctomycetaceae bacterium]
MRVRAAGGLDQMSVFIAFPAYFLPIPFSFSFPPRFVPFSRGISDVKKRNSQIAGLLQSVRQPIYLLGTDRTLLFCNRALEEWTGCEAALLLGTVLRYHTPLSRLRREIVAASLCPPPEILEGCRGVGVLSMDQITWTSRRRAEFLPLLLENDTWGTLVLVAPDEWPETGQENDFRVDHAPWVEHVSTERFESARLHQLLLTLRRRQGEPFQTDRALGTSPTMRVLRRRIEIATEKPVSVLILGEPGVGKEHVARAIHYGHEGRTPGALIPLDCRVLEAELIVSTMRAFRKRYLDDPSPRTHSLLLTDVDLLPPPVHPFLSDWIGSAPANQRILATAPPATPEWDQNRELYCLLGTLVLELPPLRDRREDIPLLAQLFLENGNAQDKRQLCGFTSEALDLLAAYDWPGNLDELESLVAEARERLESGLVGVDSLPERLLHAADAGEHPIEAEEIVPLEPFLEEVERELLRRALARAKGNKSRAAHLLGVTRAKLYRRLEWFGLLESDGSGEPDPGDR